MTSSTSADKHLLARAPWYDSGPSDVVDLQVSRSSVTAPTDPDDLRFVVGDTVRLTAWGRVATEDTVTVQVVDSSSNVKVSTPPTRTDLARWGRFSAPAVYLPSPPRIHPTPVDRARAGQRGDPAPEAVLRGTERHAERQWTWSSRCHRWSSWANDGMAVFYGGPDGALEDAPLTANVDWAVEVNLRRRHPET